MMMTPIYLGVLLNVLFSHNVPASASVDSVTSSLGTSLETSYVDTPLVATFLASSLDASYLGTSLESSSLASSLDASPVATSLPTSYTELNTMPLESVSANSMISDTNSAELSPGTDALTSETVAVTSSQSMTATMTVTLSDGFSSMLPTSVVFDTSPSASTPTPSTTTQGPTTTAAINQVKCGNNWVKLGVDTTMQLLAPQVVEYTCKPGFKETGVGVNLIQCVKNSWTPDTPLECQPIEPEPEPVEGVPSWIPLVVIALAVVLSVALVFLLALAVYVCRGNHIRRQHSPAWFQTSPPPPPPQQQQQPAPTPEKKNEKGGGGGGRRWPWQRLPPHPRGHVGSDGVAWAVSMDNDLLPVKRRF